MKYKCVIFDCDGVLVDSEAISKRVLIQMLDEMGLQVSIDYASQHFAGKWLKTIFAEIEAIIGKPLPSNFETEYRSRTFALFKSELKPVEGIHQLLHQLSIPFCVASSGPVEKIRLNLKTTNLLDQFEDKIFSSYEIDSWKPEPKIFEYAAQKMGFQAHECVVVEDSLVGIQAAKKGGFDVFGYAKPTNAAAFENEGAKVFFHMQELLELIT